MNTRQQKLLLALVVVLVAGLGLGLVWLARIPTATTVPEIVAGPAHEAAIAAAPEPAAARTELSGGEPAPAPDLETLVVFPLEVDLELVRPALVPHAPGAPPLGSAATARIKGSLHSAGDKGVRGEVAFVAGPNTGRVLYCDGLGSFGATDLYPGLSIVRVTAPGVPGSLREVLLRQDRETPLNLGYGRPASVTGEVMASDGDPIAGARVTMDGQETVTDGDGVFAFVNMTPGDVIVLVEMPGFATVREKLSVVGASAIEKGTLKYALERGARLQITIEDRINTDQPAHLFLLPEDTQSERRFPWYRNNPIDVWPGGTITIEDLPPVRVALRLYHAGAIAKPASRVVALRAGETVSESLNLVPAPVLNGTVTQDGVPTSGALVRLEAPDRVQAMLAAVGESSYTFLETEVFPNLPPAVQEVHTNSAGQFVLNASEETSKIRYLSASSADGKRSATKVLHGGEQRVDLALAPLAGGDALVRLHTTDRFQALPVQVRVNGAPRDASVLPIGRDVVVDGLTPGSWLLNVRWDTETLVEKQPLEVKGEVTWAVDLPKGALEGQDADTRKRAKRK